MTTLTRPVLDPLPERRADALADSPREGRRPRPDAHLRRVLLDASRLDKGQVIGLNTRFPQSAMQAIEIRVETGRIWLTRAEDAEDHVLVAGDVWHARRADRVVIEALEPSQVRFCIAAS